MSDDNTEASNESGMDESLPPFDFSFRNPAIQSGLFQSAVWSIASGAGGVTTAYIEGQALFFPMYFFSGLGFCYSSTFFGTSLAIKHFRKNQDDVYNHAIGGAVSFTTVGTILHGIRRGAKSGVIGAGLGAAFFYGGNWLYDNTRKNWLEFRRHVIHRTETKTVSKPVYNKSMTVQIGKRDERLPPLPVVPYSDAVKAISNNGINDAKSLEKDP
jgi:hypothetical protein